MTHNQRNATSDDAIICIGLTVIITALYFIGMSMAG